MGWQEGPSYRILHLHFVAVGGNGDASSILIYVSG